MKIALAISGVLAVIVVFIFSQYMSAASYGNRLEVQLEAVWEDNENVYSTMTSTVMEMAQVTTMAKDDIKEIITSALDARYGNKGSQAAWQFIKENNPSVDPAMYSKLMRVIESKRTEFQNAQTRLIDIKRQYKVELGGPWSGIWMRMSGYPQLNVGYPRGAVDDFAAVTSMKAKQTFETGIDTGIKLR